MMIVATSQMSRVWKYTNQGSVVVHSDAGLKSRAGASVDGVDDKLFDARLKPCRPSVIDHGSTSFVSTLAEDAFGRNVARDVDHNRSPPPTHGKLRPCNSAD
jgi:hypothetical protein